MCVGGREGVGLWNGGLACGMSVACEMGVERREM